MYDRRFRAAQAANYLANNDGGQISCTIGQGRLFITDRADNVLAWADMDAYGFWHGDDLDRALAISRDAKHAPYKRLHEVGVQINVVA